MIPHVDLNGRFDENDVDELYLDATQEELDVFFGRRWQVWSLFRVWHWSFVEAQES